LAGNNLTAATTVDRAIFGFRESDAEEAGGNANADDGGLKSDSTAIARTIIGSTSAPANATLEIKDSAHLTAPNVTLRSHVLNARARADAHARSLGARVNVEARARGEVFSKANVQLD